MKIYLLKTIEYKTSFYLDLESPCVSYRDLTAVFLRLFSRGTGAKYTHTATRIVTKVFEGASVVN